MNVWTDLSMTLLIAALTDHPSNGSIFGFLHKKLQSTVVEPFAVWLDPLRASVRGVKIGIRTISHRQIIKSVRFLKIDLSLIRGLVEQKYVILAFATISRQIVEFYFISVKNDRRSFVEFRAILMNDTGSIRAIFKSIFNNQKPISVRIFDV